MKQRRSGFTLIEMLVVIAIIAVLVTALVGGYRHVVASAKRQQAVELVSNVTTALTHMLQTRGSWPSGLADFANKDGNGAGCVRKVVDVFASWGLLGVNTSGAEKLGLLDPWGRNVIRHRDKDNVSESTQVSSGGTLRDHIVYFGIDTDLDGVVEAKVCGETVKVRASAIAWCAGADGKLGSSYHKRSKDNADNVYSWRRDDEVRE